MEPEATFTAFSGQEWIVTGPLETMVRRTKERLEAEQGATLLIFEDRTGQQVDFDWTGTVDEVLARLPSHPLLADRIAAPQANRGGPGRPKLGVVSREISLLPRHWEWLEAQTGGASAALRRLVDEARKTHAPQDRARQARDALSKFMWSMAGNLPGFEEATRALFSGDFQQLHQLIASWPIGIRGHVERLVFVCAELNAAATATAPSPTS